MNVPQIIEAVERRAPSFAKVLPRTIRVERFLAAAKTAILTVPELGECTPQSVVLACMRAAADGLVPDGRDCVLVVGRSKLDGRWVKQAQYWVMREGLQKIAFRSGMVRMLESRLVYEADAFALTYGTLPGIEHRPALKERGDVTGAYTIASLKSGHTYVEWMPREEIDGIMRRSKTFNHDTGEARGPWRSDYGEMARKTVLKRALKYLPAEVVTTRDEDSEAEAAEPEAELTRGEQQHLVEGGITYTTLQRGPDRPLDEDDPVEAAAAEMLAELGEGSEATAEDASRRMIPAEDEAAWKAELRTLRSLLKGAKDAATVESLWTGWDQLFVKVPDDVTAAAKQLVDARLYALAKDAA